MTLLISSFGFAGMGGLFSGRPRASNNGGRQNRKHRLRRTDSFELHRARLQTRHNSLTNCGHLIDPAPGAALCAVLPRQDSITLNKRRLESLEHVWGSELDQSHDDDVHQ